MLNGKTALVTGSTSGIGLGLALALARSGARVMLNGFGDVAAARADEVVDMVRACEARFGGVDILVNNAGIQHVAPVQDFPPERWDAILAINLSSAFHSTRAALPGMLTRNWGRIVNIASVHGQVASVNKSAYVAAKHGLIGLTKAVALETATTGVTVNAVCPGWVLTPLVQKQVDARAVADGVDLPEATRRLLAEKQPSLAFTTPEQLGALTVFLCSEAAANVRGQSWGMDGGWTAQ